MLEAFLRIERHSKEERPRSRSVQAGSSKDVPAKRADVAAKPKPAPATLSDELDWDEDAYQSFRKEATRASENGKVPLILAADDAAGLGQVTEVCQRFSKKKAEQLPLVNGLVTWVESRQLKRFLTSLPGGSSVYVDSPIRQTRKDVPNHIFLEAQDQEATPTATSANRLAGLDKIWGQGFRGQGQTIAVIDSGSYPHPDLKGKLAVWQDFNEGKPKPVDPFGHSTHVEGILAGTGAKSGGKIMGVAPEAQLASLRIGSVADAIKALQWVVDNKNEHNIRVVNLSLGEKATKPWKEDPWALAVQKAIDSGLVVVVAAGNNGPISTPGTLPAAITVGAVDDKGTATPGDDTLATFEAKGYKLDGVQKPDLLAPGVGIFSTLSPDSAVDVSSAPHIKKDYIALSGTSQAAPMVAALCALLLQARPDLTPAQVKDVLLRTAHHYPAIPDQEQGAGLVQADKALDLAMALPKDGAAPA